MGVKSFFGLATSHVHHDAPIVDHWNGGIEMVSRQIDGDEPGRVIKAQLDRIKLSSDRNIGQAGDVKENIGHLAYVTGFGIGQALTHEIYRTTDLAHSVRAGIDVSHDYTRERMNHLENQLDEVLQTHRNAINGLATATDLRLRDAEAVPDILPVYKAALSDIQDNLARQETYAAEGLRQLSRDAAVVIPRPGVRGSIEALADLSTKTAGKVLRYAMTLHENVHQRLQQLEGHGDAHRNLAIEGAQAADHAQDTATRALHIASRNQGRVDILSGDHRLFKERTEQSLAQNEIRGNAVEGLTTRVNEVNQHNIDNRVTLAVQGENLAVHTQKLEVHSNDIANLKAQFHDLKATSDRQVDKLADYGADLRNIARRVQNLEGLHVALAALLHRVSVLETAQAAGSSSLARLEPTDGIARSRDQHAGHFFTPNSSQT